MKLLTMWDEEDDDCNDDDDDDDCYSFSQGRDHAIDPELFLLPRYNKKIFSSSSFINECIIFPLYKSPAIFHTCTLVRGELLLLLVLLLLLLLPLLPYLFVHTNCCNNLVFGYLISLFSLLFFSSYQNNKTKHLA